MVPTKCNAGEVQNETR